jgi:hypothetical protein
MVPILLFIVPTHCNVPDLGIPCIEFYMVPVHHAEFIVIPALTSISLTNTVVANPLIDGSYTFQFGQNYLTNATDGESYFVTDVSPTVAIKNFTVNWLICPYVVGFSDNISIVQSANRLVNSQTQSLINLYSPGRIMNN